MLLNASTHSNGSSNSTDSAYSSNANPNSPPNYPSALIQQPTYTPVSRHPQQSSVLNVQPVASVASSNHPHTPERQSKYVGPASIYSQ